MRLRLLKHFTCPAACRNTLGLLGGEGYDAVAPDWVGHGDSEKPESGFDFSEASYKVALGGFIASLNIKEPFALVVHVSLGHSGTDTKAAIPWVQLW